MRPHCHVAALVVLVFKAEMDPCLLFLISVNCIDLHAVSLKD